MFHAQKFNFPWLVGRGIGGGDAAERCGADVSEFLPRRPGRSGRQCALLHGAVFGAVMEINGISAGLIIHYFMAYAP